MALPNNTRMADSSRALAQAQSGSAGGLPATTNVQRQVPNYGARQPQAKAELGMDAFQNYQNAAYGQAQRTMAPQQEADQRRFEQAMVNKGLDPRSRAFNLAQAQLQRGVNDQRNSAAFGAMQFGQNAQQQAFGQDFQNRSLRQNETQFSRNLGEQGRQFDTSMSQRESEFGRNFDFQGGQADFNNMLGLGGLALQYGSFANQGIMQDYNMAQGQLGSAPNSGVYGIDTQGAYNGSMTGANNVFQGKNQQYGALMGGIGNALGGLTMPSALEFKILKGKISQRRRNGFAARMLAMPIYNWEYKPQFKEKDDPVRFGVLANDFNREFIDNEDEQHIDLQRYTSALHLTLQELFHEMERIELLTFHVAEARGVPLTGFPFQQAKEKGKGMVFDLADKIDENPRMWTEIPESYGQNIIGEH